MLNDSPTDICVWWAPLDLDERAVGRLRELLDDAERRRVDRFRVPHAARRFTAARAALRIVLGSLTGTAPGAVEFAYGTNGKPYLAGGGPHFNASDSGDTVAIATAPHEVGIDVETVRRLPNRWRLAKRICTNHEAEMLEAFPEADTDEALLRLWTFKEAALKAVGTGLPGGLRNVEFDFGPGVTPTVRRLREHTAGWSLVTPRLRSGLLCSLIVKGHDPMFVTRRLDLQSV